MTSQQGTACTRKQNFLSVFNPFLCVDYFISPLDRIDLNHVIKVADFGLTEDVYARNYFRQTGVQGEDGEAAVKLPVKWMALESLNDGIFSEKTTW